MSQNECENILCAQTRDIGKKMKISHWMIQYDFLRFGVWNDPWLMVRVL